MQVEIRRMADGEHVSCERILRGLPDWFGIEDSIVNYVRDIQEMETWVADADGEVVGFLTLKPHNPQAAEIQVMAVAAPHHGKSCGRRLVESAEEALRSRRVKFLQVKTLAPSHPNRHYARTRGFYERMGFTPLEENELWGAVNPCLIMVKCLA